ncbi:MAG: delta-aminolevulinic acid dehydratase, partial [Bacteroidetes bacterium 4572_128]
KYLETALSSCNFIINNLNRTKKEKGFIFSYSPFDNTRVYNASLIGSRLLARSYFYTKKSELIELSKNSVISCANEQKEDGSWIYGELKVQNWVDSFHTGYNLECINEYQKYSQDFSFEKNLKIGLNYYKKNFFLEDGTPKYLIFSKKIKN